MSGNITLFILSSTGNRPKYITLSKPFFCFLVLLLLGLAGFLAAGAHDYRRLQDLEPKSRQLENRLMAKQQEIRRQRRHLQSFAEELNALKARLVALNQFERKIRTTADLDVPAAPGPMMGIGGSIPEDLDSTLALTRKHNSLIREMYDRVDQLHVASTAQESDFELLLKDIVDHQNLLAATPSISPLESGYVSSGFGIRRSPFTGRQEFHFGLDIGTPVGREVRATADGTVTFAGRKGSYGKVMVIHHGHGMVTRFAHLHKTLKKQGDKVKRGDVIALSGNTGRSTGPHLHYEVRVNGTPVNPDKYIIN